MCYDKKIKLARLSQHKGKGNAQKGIFTFILTIRFNRRYYHENIG